MRDAWEKKRETFIATNAGPKKTSLPTPLTTEQLTNLTLLSFWRRFRVICRRPTRASHDTTDETHQGDGGSALSWILLHLKKLRVTIGVTSAGAVGPRASRGSTKEKPTISLRDRAKQLKVNSEKEDSPLSAFAYSM